MVFRSLVLGIIVSKEHAVSICRIEQHCWETDYLYRVIQEERSISWEVMISVIVREKTYEHVSHSEWLLG